MCDSSADPLPVLSGFFFPPVASTFWRRQEMFHVALLLVLTDSVTEHEMKVGHRRKTQTLEELYTVMWTDVSTEREVDFVDCLWTEGHTHADFIPTPNTTEKRESYFFERTTAF